jgi:hypothetical protein
VFNGVEAAIAIADVVCRTFIMVKSFYVTVNLVCGIGLPQPVVLLKICTFNLLNLNRNKSAKSDIFYLLEPHTERFAIDFIQPHFGHLITSSLQSRLVLSIDMCPLLRLRI